MGTTPVLAIPYPELSDLADGPDGFRDMAVYIEGLLTRPFGEVVSVKTVGQTGSGVTNTSYATLSSASANFNLTTGGFLYVKAETDVQLNANGFFLQRIVGHPGSESYTYDIGSTSRRNAESSFFMYRPAGPITLSLEVAVFTGGSIGALVSSVHWLVAAQGGVSVV